MFFRQASKTKFIGYLFFILISFFLALFLGVFLYHARPFFRLDLLFSNLQNRTPGGDLSSYPNTIIPPPVDLVPTSAVKNKLWIKLKEQINLDGFYLQIYDFKYLCAQPEDSAIRAEWTKNSARIMASTPLIYIKAPGGKYYVLDKGSLGEKINNATLMKVVKDFNAGVSVALVSALQTACGSGSSGFLLGVVRNKSDTDSLPRFYRLMNINELTRVSDVRSTSEGFKYFLITEGVWDQSCNEQTGQCPAEGHFDPHRQKIFLLTTLSNGGLGYVLLGETQHKYDSKAAVDSIIAKEPQISKRLAKLLQNLRR